MTWTYSDYTVADYTITLGLALLNVLGVFAVFFSSKKGQEFVYERVIGVDPAKAHASYNDPNFRQQNLGVNPLINDGFQFNTRELFVELKQRSFLYIGILCCLLGGMTLAITAILLFQGCFLTNVRVLPGDDCPEYTVNCFIFTESAFKPITNNVSFVCKSYSKVEFNVNASDASAWCYAWIIGSQSTKSVLDQLGVAIALIGFFTTILAVIVYLGTSKKTVILSIGLIIVCSALIIVLVVLKLSFAPLTYAILAEGVILGIFGIVLYSVLSKPLPQNNNLRSNSTNMNHPKTISYPDASQKAWVDQTKSAPYNAKYPHRSTKVGPH